MDIVSSIGFIVGVLSLAYAFLQSYQSKKAAEESRKASTSLAASLELIEDSLSTRYIGPGPNFFPNICDKLSQAESEIIIVCAVPGFGYFTDFKQWTRYKSEIERKIAAGVPVKIVCLNERQRIYFQRLQFSWEGTEWDKWLKDESNNIPAKMALFLKHEHKDFFEQDIRGIAKEILAAERVISLKEFLALLESAHQRIARYDFRNAQVIETDKHLAVYLWLVDNKSAVFAIPDFGAGTRFC